MHKLTDSDVTGRTSPAPTLRCNGRLAERISVQIRKVQKGLVWLVDGPYSVALTIGELAGLAHVSVQTVNRWLRETRLPAGVAAQLRHDALGLLAHPDWHGWVIGEDGRLYAPNQHHFRPAELEQVALIYQTNRVLRRELAALEASAAAAASPRSWP